MDDPDVSGVPAGELSDEHLAAQGTQAHATRNWIFLHGSADQFSRHTSRMLELEQEYLRRFPKRTWQTYKAPAGDGLDARVNPEIAFLKRVQQSPDSRMHKLEAHHAAREAGLSGAERAFLYKSAPAPLATEGEYRVLTDEGRRRLRDAGA